jgi:hypothetical protein
MRGYHCSLHPAESVSSLRPVSVEPDYQSRTSEQSEYPVLRRSSSFSLVIFRLFCQLGLRPGSKVAFGAYLCFSVHLLGVGLEDDLLRAVSAFDVEAVDGDGVVLFVGRLFAVVGLATFIDEHSAHSALLQMLLASLVVMQDGDVETHLHRVRCHESDGLPEGPSLLRPHQPDHLRWIEVRGVSISTAPYVPTWLRLILW